MGSEAVAVPAVIREEFDWGFMLTGTREAFIAAGFNARHFVFAKGRWPDGRPGPRSSSKVITHERRKGLACKLPQAGLFSVSFDHTESERRAYERARWAQAEQAATDRALADLPTDADGYRAWLEASITRDLQSLFFACRFGKGGFRLEAAPEDDEVDLAFIALCEAIRARRIVFDPSGKAQAVTSIRARAARRDTQLQAFIWAQLSSA